LAVKEILLTKFRGFDDVVLDVPNDAPADFAGIQLIDAAHRYAALNGKRFGLARPASGPLGALLEQGGFLQEPAAGGMIWRAGAEQ